MSKRTGTLKWLIIFGASILVVIVVALWVYLGHRHGNYFFFIYSEEQVLPTEDERIQVLKSLSLGSTSLSITADERARILKSLHNE